MPSRELAAEMHDSLVMLAEELVKAQPEDKQEDVADSVLDVIDAFSEAYKKWEHFQPVKRTLKQKMNSKKRRKRMKRRS